MCQSNVVTGISSVDVTWSILVLLAAREQQVNIDFGRPCHNNALPMDAVHTLVRENRG